ncbi:hypothetical protein CHS0354_032769 [Potamilus streckersoni]|uniref:Uncharacterized protein n=1 Tax=Potamilus streckersoni TaxID=2493646 RepID=A0AAE0VKQ6_9BIVA|nr:hypothetical protein CHS0354_032769 [Potamilus streckersoni]
MFHAYTHEISFLREIFKLCQTYFTFINFRCLFSMFKFLLRVSRVVLFSDHSHLNPQYLQDLVLFKKVRQVTHELLCVQKYLLNVAEPHGINLSNLLPGCFVVGHNTIFQHMLGYTWRPVLIVEEETRKSVERFTNPREATGKLSHISTFTKS